MTKKIQEGVCHDLPGMHMSFSSFIRAEYNKQLLRNACHKKCVNMAQIPSPCMRLVSEFAMIAMTLTFYIVT